MHSFIFTLFAFFIAINSKPVTDWHTYKLQGFTQGTTYHITYYANDSTIAVRSIDSILMVIDSSMSLYKPWSQINQFNQSENGIEIDKHFQNVVNKSLEVYSASNGLFDITVKPLVETWGFYNKNKNTVPDSSLINTALSCVGSSKISLANNLLSKNKPCVQVDVNAIAQGYSVDILADFLETKKIFNYMIEIGGEIRVKGVKQPSGAGFTIGIESPVGNEINEAVFQKLIVVNKGGITTSGNYRKYFESNGKTYAHILHPKTGYPVENELLSVTVYAGDAMTADAYDNVLMALGVEKGLAFVNNHDSLAAYFIYKKPNGAIADTMSANFKKLIKGN